MARRERIARLLLVAGSLAPVGIGPGALAQPELPVPIDRAFTYQGQLRRAGAAVNGLTDFRFSLWDAPTGGTQVGPTLQLNNQNVAEGLITADLDFGPGAFNGDGRWLRIDVRNPAGAGSFTTLAPRQPILPTPYALYSLNPGPQGAQGPAGPQGVPGPQGATGAQGAIGPQGAAGVNGQDGPQGPQGPAGPQGADGAQGPQGAAGANGQDGAQGPAGPQGAAGANGLDGAQGPAGPQGAAGANGLDGAQGPAGPQGAAGANGLDGAQGPAGPQGAAGANGLDGAQGPAGPQGAAGANGLDGAQGPVGPQGAAGANGLDGAQGPAGPQGAPGVSAARYVVDPVPAAPGATHASVQAAIDQAVADGAGPAQPAVVLVRPGSYAESVVMAPGVSVQAAVASRSFATGITGSLTVDFGGDRVAAWNGVDVYGGVVFAGATRQQLYLNDATVYTNTGSGSALIVANADPASNLFARNVTLRSTAGSPDPTVAVQSGALHAQDAVIWPTSPAAASLSVSGGRAFVTRGDLRGPVSLTGTGGLSLTLSQLRTAGLPAVADASSGELLLASVGFVTANPLAAGPAFTNDGVGPSLYDALLFTNPAQTVPPGAVQLPGTGGGPQGPAGPQGAAGAQGPIGPQGAAGANGLDGAQGPAGPQGAAGAAGAQGPTGPQGAAGAPGAQGPQGAIGASPWTLNGADATYTAGGVRVGTSTPIGTEALTAVGSTTFTVRASNTNAAGSANDPAGAVRGETAQVNAAGVYGRHTGGTNVGYGLFGRTDSTASGAAGVYGYNGQSGTSSAPGILGTSFADNGRGVVGIANFVTAYGVQGQTSSTTSGAGGVFGVATGTSGNTYGVVGQASTTSGAGAGVYGTSSGTHGVLGITTATTSRSGVYGGTSSTVATAPSSVTGPVGVFGNSNSTTGAGVLGTASGGGNSGVLGEVSAGTGVGVRGRNTDTSTTTSGPVGVLGESQNANGTQPTLGAGSPSNAAKGVSGRYTGSSSTALGIGVFGETAGAGGVGVWGQNNALGSNAQRAHALVGNATNDFGVGVRGASNGANAIGLWASNNNAAGLAGRFDGEVVINGVPGTTGLTFPDGTKQTTAVVAGPQGPTGPAGLTGPQGPQGPAGASPWALSGADVQYTTGQVRIGTNTPFAGANFYASTATLTYGSVGESLSISGTGVYGNAPNGVGVQGFSNTGAGAGVRGDNAAVGGTGVYGAAAGATGTGVGVRGDTLSTTSGAGPATPAGVWGSASNASGSQIAFGVMGTTSAGLGAGVAGFGPSNGAGSGVYAEANNAGGNGLFSRGRVTIANRTSDGSPTAGTDALIAFTNAGAAGINSNAQMFASAFNLTSDRTKKDNIVPVEPRRVLDKVLGLEVSTWNLKANPESMRNMGPMAQDFHAAFGLNGTNDTQINQGDVGGVALASIQGLNAKLEGELRARDARIEALEATITARDQQLARVELRLQTLESERVKDRSGSAGLGLIAGGVPALAALLVVRRRQRRE